MLESKIEAHLVKRVKEIGGKAYKFTSPQRRSVPDRLVLMPGGRATFVECKASGQRPTDAQAREHARLWALGFPVLVVDSIAAVEAFVSGAQP
ncbi:VRR-NUC domain protein [Cupriavidus taiwanensis]|uniref:VRR-NUC domain-containing protein n=1 Tax=Cupriavidus taiwanensis TaxID=164546 RepID=UPI000E131A56|nr:VRR-NUC domain-containing protein [Cupriavidus taiwanensis]SPA25918.1 VRR-NUC domain protein [Cupriavidus taiwanensis]